MKMFSNFNSHAHVERDKMNEEYFSSIKNFNSHAHVERDDVSDVFDIDELEFQLTRSRGA